MTAIPQRAELLLGLPYLRRGTLLNRAIALGASVLVSANAFSAWRNIPPLTRTVLGGELKTFPGYREWERFRPPPAELVASLPVYLDSAGFVAAVRYGGWPWTPDDYIALCAAAPWRWFASMDWCVEPQVAQNEDAVLDRISGTIRLNIECLVRAQDRGIADRFMPVIQGWEARHYLRCLDRMWGVIDGRPIIGIGSMCRRHVHGQQGILQIIEALDREAPKGVRFHLFGLKSDGAEILRQHPRVASMDSQAYGTEARMRAMRSGVSKTNAYLADVMAEWWEGQEARLSLPGWHFQPPTDLLDLIPRHRNEIEARIACAAEELRELHEDGELDWQGCNARWAFEAAFDEFDEPAAIGRPDMGETQ